MSVMFEVLYKSPRDPVREAALADRLGRFGGRLTDSEGPSRPGGPVTLTCEFDAWPGATEAAAVLRAAGEHVEGPGGYGD